MVSHKKLYLAMVVLVVAAVSSQPPPPVPQHVSVESAEDPLDRQSGIAVALGTVLLPIFTALLTSLTSNLGTSIANAFSATMAGARLELIPIEEMLDAKTIPRDRPPQPLQRRRRVSTTSKPKEQDQ